MIFFNLTRKEYKTLITYSFVCFLILLPYFKVYNNSEFVIDKLTLLFFMLLISLAILNYWIFFLSSIFIVLVNIVFLHIIKTWGVWGIGFRVSVALESPPGEMLDYLSSYINYIDIFILLYALTCIIAIHKIKPYKVKSKILKKTAGVYIILFFVLLSFNPGRLGDDGYPITAIPLEAINTYDRQSKLSRRNDIINSITSHIDCTEKYNEIVIVMGESANKNRMSLYGYNKITTPFLDSLHPYALNVISPADTTRYAVPPELTRATPEDFDLFFSSQSIVKDLENCGYTTYWISNQGDRGKWSSHVKSIADEAMNTTFLGNKSPYDGGLIPIIKKALSKSNKKKAIFVHLYGSHFRYSSRYPKTFSDTDSANIPESYDTSIRYTDYVLSQIFNLLEKESLLFVYTSDHSDVVSSDVFGHGISPGYKDEYEIPLVIWSSNTQKLDNISILNKTSLFNNSMLYEILRYLVGIDTKITVRDNDNVIEVAPGHLVKYSNLPKYSK